MYELSVLKTQKTNAKNENDMLKGSMFEFWATGGTSSPIAEELCKDFDAGKSVTRMKRETIDSVRESALSAKKAFNQIVYCNAEFEVPVPGLETHSLVFHPDVIGEIKLPYQNPIVAIIDTKYTQSISEVWGTKHSKLDFLQSITYIAGFHEWLKINKSKVHILPFVYQVTEHGWNNPIHKYFKVNATLEDIEKFWELVRKIAQDKEFKAKPSEYNCLGKSNNNGKCRYIEHCFAGKQLIDKVEEFNYGALD